MAKQRLNAVQNELQGRGVHDVKVTLAAGVSSKGCTAVAERLATFLEAHLAGNVRRIHRVDGLGA